MRWFRVRWSRFNREQSNGSMHVSPLGRKKLHLLDSASTALQTLSDCSPVAVKHWTSVSAEHPHKQTRFRGGQKKFWNLLSLVPHSDVSQKLLRTCGEMQLKRESEHIVDTAQEIQTALHLRLDLKCNRRRVNGMQVNTESHDACRFTLPDPWCRIYEHHPAESVGLWWDPSEFLRVHYDEEHRNLRTSAAAHARSADDDRTSDCITTNTRQTYLYTDFCNDECRARDDMTSSSY